mgnify:CR=1 FL=1
MFQYIDIFNIIVSYDILEVLIFSIAYLKNREYKKAFEIFDYSQEDFKKGLNALDIIHPADKDRVMMNLQKR